MHLLLVCSISYSLWVEVKAGFELGILLGSMVGVGWGLKRLEHELERVGLPSRDSSLCSLLRVWPGYEDLSLHF